MKTIIFTAVAACLLLTNGACSATRNDTASAPTVVTVVVTATATATPEALPTPTPLLLAGSVPSDWQEIKIPVTDLSVALPTDWKVMNSQAGSVDFYSGSTGWNLDGANGTVIFLEEVPTTRLSLYRIMAEYVSKVDKIGYMTGFTYVLSDEGQLEDLPVAWAVYSYNDEARAIVGAVVTTNGTIILGLGGGENVGPNGYEDSLELIARTLKYSAPVGMVE